MLPKGSGRRRAADRPSVLWQRPLVVGEEEPLSRAPSDATRGGARANREAGRRRAANLIVIACVIAIGAGVSLILSHSGSSARAGDVTSAPVPLQPFDIGSGAAEPDGLGPEPAIPSVGDKITSNPDCSLAVEADQVMVPGLCIASPVTPAAINAGGELALASGTDDVSRWQGGAAVKGRSGTVLVAGHVSFEGRDGPFHELHRAGPGELVYLSRGSTVTAWRVVSLMSVRKERLPADVFAGSQGPRRLLLVTCAGTPELRPGGGYVYPENTLVEAVQVG